LLYFSALKKSALLGGTALIVISNIIAYSIPNLTFWAIDAGSSVIQLESDAEPDVGVQTISWRILQTFDYKENIASGELQTILNSHVKIPGFAVPLSDELNEVKEFLLVPNQMACIHVPAPPPNLIVFVSLKEGRSISELSGPLWVQGELKVQKSESTYGAAAFEMLAQSVKPYGY
jgi:hypothetical protein